MFQVRTEHFKYVDLNHCSWGPSHIYTETALKLLDWNFLWIELLCIGIEDQLWICWDSLPRNRPKWNLETVLEKRDGYKLPIENKMISTCFLPLLILHCLCLKISRRLQESFLIKLLKFTYLFFQLLYPKQDNWALKSALQNEVAWGRLCVRMCIFFLLYA